METIWGKELSMSDNINILLIEDNPGDRQLIMQEFKSFGHNFNFTIKEDGEEAINYMLKLCEQHKPDFPHLIILDLNLPRASGIEVLKQYKSNKHFAVTPIVVFSSSSSKSDILAAYSSHANCYISKPFSYEEFSEAIKSIWEFWFNITKLPKAVHAS